VILLDTHIWLWWVNNSPRLASDYRDRIRENEATDGSIRVSVISCWEVAKLVEYGKLTLTLPVDEWINTALHYPGAQLEPLTPAIAVESTRLPPGFHKDPADQIIVATARVLDCPLMTVDTQILAYPHVKKAL